MLKVNGCVELNGKIEMTLESQQNETTIDLINYNCTEKPNFSDSQIQIKTVYNNSECDQVSSKSTVSFNTLSVALNSVYICGNKKGGGLEKKYIFAIVFSVFGALILVALVVLFLKYNRKLFFEKRLKMIEKEISQQK
jgi:preprotein translocase subunit SecF